MVEVHSLIENDSEVFSLRGQGDRDIVHDKWAGHGAMCELLSEAHQFRLLSIDTKLPLIVVWLKDIKVMGKLKFCCLRVEGL